MRNLTKVILLAQKELIENPYDLIHDIRHSYHVYINCLEICEKEKLSLNLEVLEVCSWWHDLDREKDVSEKLIRILKQNNFNNKFINKCEEVINSHPFGSKQESLEAKVFFDADKLEYVNPLRFKQLLQAVKDEYISQRRIKQYKKEWYQKTGKVEKMLHFPFTRKKFTSLYKKAEKVIDKI